MLRSLADNHKLSRSGDHPPAPTYVRDQTPLKKGQMTTAALRDEFRRDPRMPIFLDDENFVKLVRKGIEEGVYVYKSGELLAGHGDPWAEIKVDEQSFVYTMAYAQEHGIWPRKIEPAAEPGIAPQPAGPDVLGVAQPPAPLMSEGGRVFKAEAPLREALTRREQFAPGSTCRPTSPRRSPSGWRVSLPAQHSSRRWRRRAHESAGRPRRLAGDAALRIAQSLPCRR